MAWRAASFNMFRFGTEQRRTIYLAAMLVVLPTLFGSPVEYRIPWKVAQTTVSASSTSENPQCRELSDEEDQTPYRTSAELKNRCSRRACDAAFIAWNVADHGILTGCVPPDAAFQTPSVKLCENARHCRSGIQLS